MSCFFSRWERGESLLTPGSIDAATSGRTAGVGTLHPDWCGNLWPFSGDDGCQECHHNDLTSSPFVQRAKHHWLCVPWARSWKIKHRKATPSLQRQTTTQAHIHTSGQRGVAILLNLFLCLWTQEPHTDSPKSLRDSHPQPSCHAVTRLTAAAPCGIIFIKTHLSHHIQSSFWLFRLSSFSCFLQRGIL